MFDEMKKEELIEVDGGGVCGAVIGFGLGMAYGALNDAFKQSSGEYNSKGAIGRIFKKGVSGALAGAACPTL